MTDVKNDPVTNAIAVAEAVIELATDQVKDQSRSRVLNYRGGLKYAFHHAVRGHREGLAMLLRDAESQGDEGLTELLRKDLAQLDGL